MALALLTRESNITPSVITRCSLTNSRGYFSHLFPYGKGGKCTMYYVLCTQYIITTRVVITPPFTLFVFKARLRGT